MHEFIVTIGRSFISIHPEMAPRVLIPTGVIHEADDEIPVEAFTSKNSKPSVRKYRIHWWWVLFHLYAYIVGVYGFYLCLKSAKWQTSFFGT